MGEWFWEQHSPQTNLLLIIIIFAECVYIKQEVIKIEPEEYPQSPQETFEQENAHYFQNAPKFLDIKRVPLFPPDATVDSKNSSEQIILNLLII